MTFPDPEWLSRRTIIHHSSNSPMPHRQCLHLVTPTSPGDYQHWLSQSIQHTISLSHLIGTGCSSHTQFTIATNIPPPPIHNPNLHKPLITIQTPPPSPSKYTPHSTSITHS